MKKQAFTTEDTESTEERQRNLRIENVVVFLRFSSLFSVLSVVKNRVVVLLVQTC